MYMFLFVWNIFKHSSILSFPLVAIKECWKKTSQVDKHCWHSWMLINTIRVWDEEEWDNDYVNGMMGR